MALKQERGDYRTISAGSVSRVIDRWGLGVKEGRVFFVLRDDLETGVAGGVEEVFSTMTIC